MIYAALSIMFFMLPFDLVERRAPPSTNTGLAFGQKASSILSAIGPMKLLGLSQVLHLAKALVSLDLSLHP